MNDKLALPPRADERQCPFVAIPVHKVGPMGQPLGMSVQRLPCNAQCAIYDRRRDQPCLAAFLEKLDEAMEVLKEAFPSRARA